MRSGRDTGTLDSYQVQEASMDSKSYPISGPHTCGRCPARWGGANTSHCSMCHRTFSTVRNFDKHLDHARDRLVCLAPEDKGLVIDSRGIYVLPAAENMAEIFSAAQAIGGAA